MYRGFSINKQKWVYGNRFGTYTNTKTDIEEEYISFHGKKEKVYPYSISKSVFFDSNGNGVFFNDIVVIENNFIQKYCQVEKNLITGEPEFVTDNKRYTSEQFKKEFGKSIIVKVGDIYTLDNPFKKGVFV